MPDYLVVCPDKYMQWDIFIAENAQNPREAIQQAIEFGYDNNGKYYVADFSRVAEANVSPRDSYHIEFVKSFTT